ncbi:ATP-binding protein [Clostridia bacterium OttesenSCG-928-O13]|nr:ATP-binding protein [Clostridia bacterium OttesenSCG-928-O13]
MDTCPVCGEKTKGTVKTLGIEMQVSIACKCRRAELEAERQREELRRQAQRTQELRRRCFGNSALAQCTFAQDDAKLAKISAAMKRYADNFPQMQAENMGILLHGPVGGGKSFYAACIANALIEQGRSAIMTNFSTVVNDLQESFSGRQAYLDRLASVSLLILDDLGIERETPYMQEQVYNIIDTRYRAKKPLIVTTNIALEEIVEPKDLTYERIYDRVLEMCHPVKVNLASRRRSKIEAENSRRKNILGV